MCTMCPGSQGLKLPVLKQYRVLESLAKLVGEKNPRSRQGALFAYERLFYELGSHLEPYIPRILPLLLECFGDTNQVRPSV